MVGAGDSQWAKGAPNASQDASGTRRPNRQNGGEQPRERGKADAEWHQLVDCLNGIVGDLKKTEEEAPRVGILRGAQDALLAVRALWAKASRNATPLEERLMSIEKKIDSWGKPKDDAGGKGTWATVAAQATMATRMANAPVVQRTAIRIRVDDPTGKTPKEILDTVKPIVQGACAIRPLRSGDFEVLMRDQKLKDAALNQPQVGGMKILRQDYPVEIPGAPLTLRVESGKEANNSELINGIRAASRPFVPNLAINRVRWLHAPKEHEVRVAAGKTRGTLILSLPTQAMQHEVVRKGLAIEAQFYEARLFDHGIEVKQCFRCGQWGHTQSACGKPEKCGQCAGDHRTEGCIADRVSCSNCGRAHRTWQKKECKTYERYLEGIKQRRALLAAQSIRLRSGTIGTPQATLQADGFELVQPRKRRLPTDSQMDPPPRRGPGRPRNTEIASRDQSQSRIRLVNATQEESIPNTQDFAMNGSISDEDL